MSQIYYPYYPGLVAGVSGTSGNTTNLTPYNVLQITTTGPYFIPTARLVLGIYNLATVYQTLTLTGYDNASALSGTVIVKATQLAPVGSAGSAVEYPLPGMPLVNGLSIGCTSAPLGDGIQVLWAV